MNIDRIRREYLRGGLRRRALPGDPMILFEQWLTQAINAEIPDPTAMVLGTVDEQHRPEQRIVLLKGYDQRGLVFFTNYQSAKGRELANNPAASLLFPWHGFERQVRISGNAQKLPEAESAEYFASRPRESQLAAWASQQSETIASRAQLLRRYQKVADQFEDDPVPMPTFWGGYRVAPQRWEFWQGGASRLHDRFEYKECSGGWNIARLSP